MIVDTHCTVVGWVGRSETTAFPSVASVPLRCSRTKAAGTVKAAIRRSPDTRSDGLFSEHFRSNESDKRVGGQWELVIVRNLGESNKAQRSRKQASVSSTHAVAGTAGFRDTRCRYALHAVGTKSNLLIDVWEIGSTQRAQIEATSGLRVF